MKPTLRVLIVEDSPGDAELMEIELQRNGHEPITRRVETAEAMRLALVDSSWDVILADYALPRFSGTTALTLLKDSRLDLPLIIVTGTLGEAAAVDAMRAGAKDYILKSNLSRLAAVVDREVRESANRRERKRAEAQRDHALHLLQLQVERMPLAYLLSDETFRYIRWNPAAEKIFGFTQEEVLGKHPFEVIVPLHSQPMLREIFERVKNGDMAAHGICENLRNDGQLIVCEWHNTPLQDRDGIFLGIISLAQDITERRRSEEAIRLSEMRKLAIVEASLDAIITIDHEAKLVEINRSAEQMFGLRRQDVLGQDMVELLMPATLRKLGRAGIERYLATGESHVIGKRTEMNALRACGEEFPIEITITRIATQGPPMFTAHIRDLSEKKRLEGQYRQSQKMEAIGQLAAGVAHDFNNLLTVISSYGEILLQRLPEGTSDCDLVLEIIKAGERAAALTRQLLMFSRQQVLAPKVVDLNSIVLDVEKMLCRVIGENIKLMTELQLNLHCVKADPGQIEQVLVNLAVNARDAMPEGGNLVVQTQNVDLDEQYVQAHAESRCGPHVLLAVRDTGFGMTAQVQARLFEPFFTTKEKGKGTGLGLATVHSIVKECGGHIGVQSSVGVGTSFSIYLPRTETLAVVPWSPPGNAPDPRGSETVLLVEDEDTVRSLARITLETNGYKVLEAAHGEEALCIAQQYQETIHLLLTDVVMPGLGGRQLAEQLRGTHPVMKVLFFSGYTDDAVVHQGVFRETVNFLGKPFTPSVLARKVREVLDAPPQPQSV